MASVAATATAIAIATAIVAFIDRQHVAATWQLRLATLSAIPRKVAA